MRRRNGATPELDEGCLQRIFEMVGDVRQQARCSMVCKRWRDACYSGAVLYFNFNPNSQEEMRAHEDAIATVLQRARRNAPGYLKILMVDLSCCGSTARKSSGHWLAFADSLTLLILSTPGPAWSHLMTSQTLQHLIILSNSATFLNDVHESTMQGWMSPRLQSCKLDFSVSVELLHALLAACPVLESLFIGDLRLSETQPVLTLSRSSLTKLHLSGPSPCSVARFQVFLHNVPNLSTLSLASLAKITDVRTEHTIDKLKDIRLGGLCTFDRVFDQVEKLKLKGIWELTEEVDSVFKHTPWITSLSLITFRGPIISSLLPEMQCLKHIVVDMYSLLSLDSHVRLEEMTVRAYFDLDQVSSKEYEALKYLLDTCRARRLVLDFERVVPQFQMPQLVDDLCKLYPDQVSVEFTKRYPWTC